LRHRTCSHIHMYINAVAKSVMLYLRHDFYNIIFNIKYKLYIASGSVPPPPPAPRKNSGCTPVTLITFQNDLHRSSLCTILHVSKQNYVVLVFARGGSKREGGS
jgi:hypothetical protein